MYFQYITNLYDRDDLDAIVTKHIGDWLRTNVGVEGSARESESDYDWAWSLTTYLNTSAPVGIYFKDTQDQLRFRLSFNIGFGRPKS